MSITSGVATLDTSWQEQNTVAFTPGVLTSVSDMVTEVGKRLKRGTLSASTTPTSTDVTNWCHRGKEELAEIKNFTFARRYAYVTLSAGDYRISLPPDFNGGKIRLKDTTNDRYLTYFDPDTFDMKYPDPSAETQRVVLIYTIKNLEMFLTPPPDSADVLELEYERSGSEATTMDWLPEMERWRVTDFATAMSFYSLHMWEEGDRYFGMWTNGLGKAVRADAKRKWLARRGCLNVFQEHRLKTYQPYRYYT